MNSSSRCVRVSYNNDTDISLDKLTKYFQTTEDSCGGKLDAKLRQEGNGKVVVCFKEENVAIHVLQKEKHILKCDNKEYCLSVTPVVSFPGGGNTTSHLLDDASSTSDSFVQITPKELGSGVNIKPQNIHIQVKHTDVSQMQRVKKNRKLPTVQSNHNQEQPYGSFYVGYQSKASLHNIMSNQLQDPQSGTKYFDVKQPTFTSQKCKLKPKILQSSILSDNNVHHSTKTQSSNFCQNEHYQQSTAGYPRYKHMYQQQHYDYGNQINQCQPNTSQPRVPFQYQTDIGQPHSLMQHQQSTKLSEWESNSIPSTHQIYVAPPQYLVPYQQPNINFNQPNQHVFHQQYVDQYGQVVYHQPNIYRPQQYPPVVHQQLNFGQNGTALEQPIMHQPNQYLPFSVANIGRPNYYENIPDIHQQPNIGQQYEYNPVGHQRSNIVQPKPYGNSPDIHQQPNINQQRHNPIPTSETKITQCQTKIVQSKQCVTNPVVQQENIHQQNLRRPNQDSQTAIHQESVEENMDGFTDNQTAESMKPLEENKSGRTIEAIGIKPSTSDEAIILFFESEKKGGGTIEEIHIDRERNSAVITFTDSSVAVNILNKGRFTIDKAEIHVKKAHPVLVDKTKLFVRDIHLNTSEGLLTLFLKDLSKAEITSDIEYGMESGTALVQFEEEVVIQDMRHHLLTQLLFTKNLKEFSDLKFEEVEITRTIQVHNIPSSINDELISLYFENTKKSGGGEVVEVKYKESEKCALVTFAEYDVIQSVLAKKHTIAETELVVRPFKKCLGMLPPGFDTGSPTLQVPDPVSLEGDEAIIGFISQYPSHIATLKNAVSNVHGKITSIDSNKVVIECILTKQIENAIELSKIWINEVTQTFDNFIQQFCQKKISVDDTEAYQQIMCSVEDQQDLELTIPTESCSIIINDEQFSFHLVGIKDKVDIKFNLLKQIVQKVLKKQEQNAMYMIQHEERKYINPQSQEKHCCKEDKSERTIEATGFKASTTDEVIELFFENKKKSGGGEIEEMHVDRDRDSAVITFTDSSVAVEVLSKSPFTIAKAEICVKKAHPVLIDKTKLFVRDINPETNERLLTLFLNKLCKTEIISDIEYGMVSGTAMVKFQEEVAIQETRHRLSQLLLNKQWEEFSELKFEGVVITRTIQVHNIPSPIHKEMISLYFENTNRSGGGQVVEVKYNENETCALVTFAEYDVIQSVLARKHTMSGVEFVVLPFDKCLGILPPSFDTTRLRLQVPDPVSIEGDDVIIGFINQHPSHITSLQTAIAGMYGKITSNAANKVVIECVLTRKIKNANNLSQSWVKEVTQAFDNFIQQFSKKEIPLGDKDAYQRVMGIVENQPYLEPTEDCSLIINDKEFTIQLVGRKDSVDRNFKLLNNLVQNELEKLAKDKEIKDNKVSDIPNFKLCFLLNCNYPDRAYKEFPNITKCDIDLKANIIYLKGPNADIKKMKTKLFELLNNLKEDSFNFSPELLSFIDTDACQKHLAKKCRSDEIIGIWNLVENKLDIYAETEDNLSKLQCMIKANIAEKEIWVEQESYQALQQSEWNELCRKLEDNSHQLLTIDTSAEKSYIRLLGISQYISQAMETIKNYIQINTIVKKSIQIKSSKAQFFKTHFQTEIQTVLHTLRKHSPIIEVKPEESMISIQSTKDGIKEVEMEIDKLVGSIQMHVHNVSKPGMHKYFQKSESTGALRTIADKTKSFIVIEKPDKENWRGKLVEGERTWNHSSGAIFKCLKVDITSLDVDVIVNAANTSLQHGGGVARAIVKKGGYDIQTQSEKFLKDLKRQKLDDGDIAWTGPGSLICRRIYHACGPQWKDGKHGEELILKKVTERCLTRLLNDGYRTIAFPAICSGIYRYPIPLTTKAIVDAANEYCSQNKRSVKDKSITIYFVDISEEAVNKFISALNGVAALTPAHGEDTSCSSKKMEGTCTSDDNLEEEDIASRGSADFKSRGLNEVITQEGVIIKLVRGQLASEKVDVIVNTTKSDLSLGVGGVSKSILVAAGSEIQDEIKKKYPTGLISGQIAMTMGHKLNCKGVYHVFCPNWDNGNGKSEQALRKVLRDCLQSASDSRHKPTSIAFPAIGTGVLGYPKDDVARFMFEEVRNFSLNNKRTLLRNIHFVVYENDHSTVAAFESKMDEIKQGRMIHSSIYSVSGMLGAIGGSGTTTKKKDVSAKGMQEIHFGRIRCQIESGDISKENVHAIVNSTTDKFEHSRGVSNAIFNAGGQEVINECNQLTLTGGISNGLAVTQGGKLPCKYIIHVDAQFYNPYWKKPVIQILQEAEARSCKSIAFPALGTGNLGADVQEVASQILDGIECFANTSSKKSKVELVRIVLYVENMTTDFQIVLKKKGLFKPKTSWLRKTLDILSVIPGDDIMVKAKRVSLSVTFNIYSSSRQNIEKAVKKIDKHAEKLSGVKSISDGQIASLEMEHVAAINKTAEEHGVEIYIIGHEIELRGLKSDIALVETEIMTMIQSITKNTLREAVAENINKEVQWQYKDKDMIFQEYSPCANLEIETAFQQKKTSCILKEEGLKCPIYFNYSNQDHHMVHEDGKIVDVKRHAIKKGSIDLPKTWETMDNEGHYITVILKQSSNEYKNIEKQFKKTAKNIILKIERIQNPVLYKKFSAVKEGMDMKNKSNEKQLFHGTSANVIETINTNGFNRSYCGKNATLYGEGVYFARDASYSTRYASEGKQMYLCRVLVGEYTIGQPDYKAPPPKQGTILYDSVVNNMANPGIYVIFHDDQAYPEYLITFQ